MKWIAGRAVGNVNLIIIAGNFRAYTTGWSYSYMADAEKGSSLKIILKLKREVKMKF